MQTFLILFAAHAVGDFLLQTDRDVAEKHRPAILLKHGLTHMAAALLLGGTWDLWLPVTFVAATHVAIDYTKSRYSSGDWKAFLVDQGLHLLVIALVSSMALQPDVLWEELFGSGYYTALAVAGGVILTVRAGAYFMDLAVVPFLTQLNAGSDMGRGEGFEAAERAAASRLRGLRDGGRMIGQLERALIFLFMLMDHVSAIGFLIAAKSIFRFGELRDRTNRMEAEYIIIGTLISFLWAIVLSLFTRWIAGIG